MVWESIFALALAQSTPSIASIPNYTDLKAAFCLGCFQDIASIDLGSFPEAMRADAQKVHCEVAQAEQRLRVYLFPRMQYLEPLGIGAAFNQGKLTAQEAMQVAEPCLQNLESSECKRMSANARNCRETPFLPF